LDTVFSSPRFLRGSRRVELDSPADFSHLMGLKSLASGPAGRASVGEVKATVVLWTLDHFLHNESVGKVGFAMSADAIGGVKLPFTVAVDCVGLVVVIDSNDCRVFKSS